MGLIFVISESICLIKLKQPEVQWNKWEAEYWYKITEIKLNTYKTQLQVEDWISYTCLQWNQQKNKTKYTQKIIQETLSAHLKGLTYKLVLLLKEH